MAVRDGQGPQAGVARAVGHPHAVQVFRRDLDAVGPGRKGRHLAGDRAGGRRVGDPLCAFLGDVDGLGVGVASRALADHVQESGPTTRGQLRVHRLQRLAQRLQVVIGGRPEPQALPAQLGGRARLVVRRVDRRLGGIFRRLAHPSPLLLGQAVQPFLRERQHEDLRPQHDVGRDVADVGVAATEEGLGDVELDTPQRPVRDLAGQLAEPEVDGLATPGRHRGRLQRRVVDAERLSLPNRQVTAAAPLRRRAAGVDRQPGPGPPHRSPRAAARPRRRPDRRRDPSRRRS